MKEVRSSEELMVQLSNLNGKNSVCQVYIPGKGKFTIVLQEGDTSFTAQVTSSPYQKNKMNDTMEAKKEGHIMSASELKRNPFL